MTNIGIETSLRMIANRAWRDREDPTVYKTTKALIGGLETVHAKVSAISEHVRHLSRVRKLATEAFDADDALLAAATMCLAVGIPCRVVGAQYGQSWTCWLAYQDGGQWITVDVLVDVPVRDRVKPDEEVIVECGGVFSQTLTQAADRMREPYTSIIWHPNREECELPGGVHLEARDKTTYNVERYVTLKAKDPEFPDNQIRVTVGGSVSSYKAEAMAPRLQFSLHSVWTRKQWELVKRLSDQAWDEYEKRFLTKE